MARENEVHRLAFEVWFSLGKNFAKTRDTLRHNQPPVKASRSTLYRWADRFDWDSRAREREVAIQKKLMDDSVEEQVEFMKKKGNMGRLLQREAVKFLSKTITTTDPDTGKPRIVIERAHEAILALQAGLALEQEAIGWPAWITELMDADDQTLQSVFDAALADIQSNQRIAAEEGDDSDARHPPVIIEPLSQDSDGGQGG